MASLEDIVAASVDAAVSVSVLLRKCLVLADELRNEVFRDWLLNELKGYKNHESLPDYRVIKVQAKGLFLGPFGSQIRDQGIPSGAIDPRHRWWATTAYLMDGIAAYEGLTEGDDSIVIPWPPDLVAKYQSKIVDGWALNRAHQEIPLSAVRVLVDSVRNRVLELALSLRNEIGPNEGRLQDVSPERVNSAVITIIFGGNNVVASHLVGDVKQIGDYTVIEGDFVSLSNVLADLGIPKEDIGKLEEAINTDKKSGDKKGFGASTAAWLGKALMNVGKEGAKIVGDVAKATLTKAVTAYFGLQ